jgi:hypothetical protein
MLQREPILNQTVYGADGADNNDHHTIGSPSSFRRLT